MKHAVNLNGFTVVWRLFPHGIFELPAIIISLGLGFKLGVEIFTKRQIAKNLREIFKIIFLIIVPLLFIAAIIEGSLIFLIG
jgi:stage II sporulation protein M